MGLKTGEYGKYILNLAHLPIGKEIQRNKNIKTEVHKISKFPHHHGAFQFFNF